MIYAVLKILARLTIWGYFRKVKHVGKEKVPKKGPHIFVANHPSAFMDPIVVASAVKPPVYFIAAGEYVGKGIKGWIFQNLLHMIPVFRPGTRPEETHKNKDMFVRCYEHLSKKGALLIFPEGVSLTEKKLKPLKTGTVRIALGAEAMHDFKLGVPIIPIGLNYSDPHAFRSDLFVKIGEPIYITDFRTSEALSNESDKASEIELAREVTAFLQTAMQRTILHLDSDQEELMLSKLETIYARDIRAKLEIAFDDQESEFEMQKDFIDAIDYFKSNQPAVYKQTEEEIDTYLAGLKAHELSDKDIGDFHKRYRYRRFFSFILGFPFFIFGLVHNYLPYRGVGFFASKIKLDETFSGSVSLAIGLFLFLFWYIGVSIGIGYLWLGWMAVFYPILMYVTGLYTLLYSTAVSHSRQRTHLRQLIKTNRAAVTELIIQRAQIISTLKVCETDYLAYKEASSTS